jgi:pimeloyl-ACP methyl ester carboxylesterase
MSKADIKVTREDILVPFGSLLVSVAVRRYRPASPRGLVFCFHGFAGRAEDFGELAAFLAANGFEVLAPDMAGRGESGAFADPRDYSFRNILKVVETVIDFYANGSPRSLIGVGWGGLLALVSSAGRAPNSFLRVIATEVPARYAIEDDAVIADAAARATASFPTSEAGLLGLLQSPEFAGLSLNDMRSRTYRLRWRDGGFSFHYDPGIAARQADHRRKIYAIETLVPSDGSRLLMLGTFAAGWSPNEAGPNLVTVANPYARLDTYGERLMVLGFLASGATQSDLPGCGKAQPR